MIKTIDAFSVQVSVSSKKGYYISDESFEKIQGLCPVIDDVVAENLQNHDIVINVKIDSGSNEIIFKLENEYTSMSKDQISKLFSGAKSIKISRGNKSTAVLELIYEIIPAK